MAAKVFELESVRNHVHKNGFDLSSSRIFSAAPGMLNCPYQLEVVPGDKIRINLENLTRTLPLNTAAYARAKEYWDFFYVPYRLLWSWFNNMIIRNPRGDSQIRQNETGCPTVVPVFDLVKLNQVLYNDSTTNDDAGERMSETTPKLMEQLGYPVNLDFDQSRAPWYVNPFRLLAYQKVYQDFYRDTQWEEYDASSFNLDYLHNTGTAINANVFEPRFISDGLLNYNQQIFKMRYANYKKDMFFGLRPSTQFGDVSVVSTQNYLTYESGTVGPGSSQMKSYKANPFAIVDTENNILTLQSTFDILTLRRAEALQRLNEITQANDFRYNAQILARFGEKVPDSRAQMAEYLGGHSNALRISDVEGTAATDKSQLGQLAGKGTMISQNDKSINFEAHEHGIILCIYHILPMVNYPAVGIDKANRYFQFEDWYQPEFQNIGLAAVRGEQLCLDQENENNPVLGYGPRYLEYKTAIDKAFDEFKGNGNLSAWTIPFPNAQLNTILHYGMNYLSRKVQPGSMNSIFGFNYTITTCPFLVNSYFDVKAVRPMSVDGMPY